MAIILPGIILLINLLNRGKMKQLLINIFPYGLVSLIYLLLTSTLFDLPSQAVYQPIFSIKSILNSLGWYILWCFNLPEILSDFIGPKLALNQNFIKWYPVYFWSVLTTFSGVLIILALFVIKLRKKIFNRQLTFLVLSFVVSSAPFLFFPQHKYVYYLSFALIWFSAALGFILAQGWDQKRLKLLVPVCLILLAFTSYQTINLYASTYWAAKRAAAAKFMVGDILKNYPKVPNGTTFYFKNDPDYPVIDEQWGGSSKQVFVILSGSDALKLIYNDLSVKAYFEDIERPQNEKDPSLIIYTAKFPY
jgi:hypothetical protein